MKKTLFIIKALLTGKQLFRATRTSGNIVNGNIYTIYRKGDLFMIRNHQGTTGTYNYSLIESFKPVF